jgi:uncharacterized protein (DUF1499 family)
MRIHEAMRIWLTAAVALAPLAGCAAPGEPGGGGKPAAAPSVGSLACTLPSNCVSSIDSVDPGPLRFDGTAQQALAALSATIAGFPEAKVVQSDGLHIQAIFTTPIGFRDQVDFSVDPQGGRIDYRSKSLVGLYDFGKNRSRMREFAERFARQHGR